MDEKGESSGRENDVPEPSELDETMSRNSENASLSTKDSAETDAKQAPNQAGDVDSFDGFSDEETEALDSTIEVEEETFRDPHPDWDDEEILEDVSRKRYKPWVVTGIIVAVIAALSFTVWWLFFLKDPPYPLPDAFKILRRQPIEDEGRNTSLFTLKNEIRKRQFSEVNARPNVQGHIQKMEQGQALGNFSTGEPSTLEIDRKLSEAVTLRKELLKKQKEIRDLQRTYRERIKTVEKEILDEMQKTKVNTFAEAVKIKLVEYGLRTIHRRKAYIRNLNIPLDQLHFAGEELLYLERLTRIQLEMCKVAKGVDLKTLTTKIDRTVRKHQNGLNRLSVQRDNPPSPDLEATWKDVLRKTKKKVAHEESEREKRPPQRQAQINGKILDEIQKGKLSRKQELTWLSPEGASVLSAWSGKVLYLNGLSTLHASTAKILARWQGNWLCLNGLQEISPETARSLSQWPGKRLSLNGLKSIGDETARELSSWNGLELEMVGLAEASPEAISHFKNWEHSGKRMYFSKNFREDIPRKTR